MTRPADLPPAAAADVPDDGPRLLSPASFGISLGICLVIFVALNPFWEQLDMEQVNDNILWSYAPIPLLVLVFLTLEKKLGLLAFVLDCIRLTFVKFAITFIAAQLLWGFAGPPPLELPGATGADAPATHATASGESKDDFFVREPPAASVLAPADLGALSGQVTDGQGRPVADALVLVSDGLEAFVFAPPAAAIELHNHAGWHADEIVLQAHQLVRLHADPDQLHTAELRGPDGRPLFNYPLAPGNTRELMFKRGLGQVLLACKVHGTNEPALNLWVTDNPFVTRTDPDGRFHFEGVPAGALTLTTWSPGAAPVSQACQLPPGASAEIPLGLP